MSHHWHHSRHGWYLNVGHWLSIGWDRYTNPPKRAFNLRLFGLSARIDCPNEQYRRSKRGSQWLQDEYGHILNPPKESA